MSESPEKTVELLALERAVVTAGSQTALASKIGKKQGHVSVWLIRGRCAADAVLPIEAATGVSRHALRPDIFGPGNQTEAAE